MEWWNRDRARQLISFDDMPYGATDIDGVTDHHGRVFVWYEAKHRQNEAPFGQKLALENHVRMAKDAGRHATAIIVEHYVDNTQSDVKLCDCMVREVFTTEGLKWRPPHAPITAGQYADAYIKYWEKRNNVVRVQNRL